MVGVRVIVADHFQSLPFGLEFALQELLGGDGVAPVLRPVLTGVLCRAYGDDDLVTIYNAAEKDAACLARIASLAVMAYLCHILG